MLAITLGQVSSSLGYLMVLIPLNYSIMSHPLTFYSFSSRALRSCYVAEDSFAGHVQHDGALPSARPLHGQSTDPSPGPQLKPQRLMLINVRQKYLHIESIRC